MRRGLTMLELLLSLALLSAVMVTASAWIRLAGAAGMHLQGPARWEASARAALQLIDDDLLVADLQATTKREPRCAIADNGDLVVRTRLGCTGDASGMVEHRYGLDPIAGALRLREKNAAGAIETRRLIEGVGSWSCAIDDEKPILAIEIVSRDGATAGRSYRLP